MDLHVFWFCLLGILLAGYAVLDGFDLGVGTLHLLAKGDAERRVLLNSIGPVWDGNEVWLVTFGGALFAAFPEAYATAFSAFYLPFMLLLVALIFRAVALEFRSKRPSPLWRSAWDVAFFLASALGALLFGVAVGAVMRGLPLGEGHEYTGGVLDLLSPWSLLVGLFTVSLFALHGAVYLYGKTDGALQKRVQGWVWTAAGSFFALFMLTTIVALLHVPRASANFRQMPWGWAVVVAEVLALANVPRAVYRQRPREAFVSSALAVACLVALFGLAQFPNLLTNSARPEESLTCFNASSSEKTLAIMRIVAFLGMPFVLVYTAVIYWVFRGKVTVGKHSY